MELCVNFYWENFGFVICTFRLSTVNTLNKKKKVKVFKKPMQLSSTNFNDISFKNVALFLSSQFERKKSSFFSEPINSEDLGTIV